MPDAMPRNLAAKPTEGHHKMNINNINAYRSKSTAAMQMGKLFCIALSLVLLAGRVMPKAAGDANASDANIDSAGAAQEQAAKIEVLSAKRPTQEQAEMVGASLPYVARAIFGGKGGKICAASGNWSIDSYEMPSGSAAGIVDAINSGMHELIYSGEDGASLFAGKSRRITNSALFLPIGGFDDCPYEIIVDFDENAILAACVATTVAFNEEGNIYEFDFPVVRIAVYQTDDETVSKIKSAIDCEYKTYYYLERLDGLGLKKPE